MLRNDAIKLQKIEAGIKPNFEKNKNKNYGKCRKERK